jgi:hypothetical protein
MRKVNVESLKERFGVVELWNTTLVNTTPHAINVMLQGEIIEIPAAKQPLRLKEEVTFTGIAGAIPLFRKQFFLEDELPPEDDDGEILYIVPAIIAQFFRKTRRDLVVPHDFVRDTNGNILGCQGLAFLD